MKLLTIISGLAMLVSMASGAAVAPRQSPAEQSPGQSPAGDTVSLWGGPFFPERRWGWCARGYWCYYDEDCRRQWSCLRETWGDRWKIFCGTYKWPHSCYYSYDWRPFDKKGGHPKAIPVSSMSGGGDGSSGSDDDSQPSDTTPTQPAPSGQTQAMA
ncbi:hypothetical protein EMCG_08743 [[Emmonsia] crescens]|uniref:Uncharacterized protein n=1 Tax=[Emmonsia] crescens TaxID=73230 RepID=A0A0G2J3Z9_9EURO|nr:hypothetical protein EMCG_08743 [Emmonsia crescens UAMH 3008]